MKKTVLSAAVLAVVGFTSCEKENLNPADLTKGGMSFSQETSNENMSLRLASSNYTTNITKDLVSSASEGQYTEGTIEYLVDGNVVATVDFGNGEQDFSATKTVLFFFVLHLLDSTVDVVSTIAVEELFYHAMCSINVLHIFLALAWRGQRRRAWTWRPRWLRRRPTRWL